MFSPLETCWDCRGLFSAVDLDLSKELRPNLTPQPKSSFCQIVYEQCSVLLRHLLCSCLLLAFS